MEDTLKIKNRLHMIQISNIRYPNITEETWIQWQECYVQWNILPVLSARSLKSAALIQADDNLFLAIATKAQRPLDLL